MNIANKYYLLKIMIKENLSWVKKVFKKDQNIEVKIGKIIIALIAISILAELFFLYTQIAFLGSELLIKTGLIITIIFVVIQSIPNILSNMFQAIDILMFAHLPVNRTDIIFSRLMLCVIKGLLLSIGLGIQVLLAGIVTNKFSLSNSLVFFLLLVIIPIIIVGIISIFMMIIFKLEKRYHIRGIVTAIFSIIIYVFVLTGIVIFQFSILQEISKNHSIDIKRIAYIVSEFSKNVFERIHLNSLISYLFSENFSSVITILLLLSISFLIIFISCYIYNTLYNSLEYLIDSTYNGNNKKRIIANSSNNLLLKREWWIIRDKSFFTYELVQGILIPPVALGATIILMFNIYGITSLNNIYKIVANFKYLNLAAVNLIVAMATINVILPTSLSREGKYFYISKIIPVKYKKQFCFKVINGVIISFISMMIISIIIYFTRIPLKSYFTVMLYSIGLIVLINVICLIFDLRNPNIRWTNPKDAISTNISSSLHVLLVIVILIIFNIIMVILLTVGIPQIIIECIAVSLLIINSVLLYKYLRKRLVDYYNRVSL